MKVVLLHDWLTGLRGGERVLQAFCEMFPDAPIYTLIYKKNSVGGEIEKRSIRTGFLDNIPGVYRHYRKLLPLFPWCASRLKIDDEADLVLSSSHCVIKGVKKPFGAKHISYIHSPMRYLYDQYDHYWGSSAPLYQRLGIKLFKNYLVKWDLESNNNVDMMIANSSFVRERISKYYDRKSMVIHPFVELNDFVWVKEKNIVKKDYYLVVSAFAPNKKIDLAIRAFNKLGRPLKVIGYGQQEFWLKNLAQKNIEFLGCLPREDVINHLAYAKGLIFPGIEDFGITPLESLAAGTPVVARREGGVLETLNEDVAEFFEPNDSDSEESLIEAVKKFERRDFSRDKLFSRAASFSKEIFKRKILSAIDKERV